MIDEEKLNEGVGTQSHYMDCAIQPIEYILANKMDFLEGNIIKYVSRYKQKNGLEDLEKARQYLDWLIEQISKQDGPPKINMTIAAPHAGLFKDLKDKDAN